VLFHLQFSEFCAEFGVGITDSRQAEWRDSQLVAKIKHSVSGNRPVSLGMASGHLAKAEVAIVLVR
jgi:hypothetical protein